MRRGINSQISKRGLDRAGKVIRLHQNDDEYRAAIELLNRWREQHVLPMDFFFDTCNEIAKAPQYDGALIAERLKRLPTIIDKLNRFPHMQLSSMQDVGGVRVILEGIPSLEHFDQEIRKIPILKSSKDYLAEPKSSGYRGRHLIFEHDDMTIEIQLRTQLQHLWATSVETVDVIRGTSMKTKQSNDYWQKFFELVSSAFAYMENLPMLPQHQGWGISRLLNALREVIRAHEINDTLSAYATTYKVLDGYEQSKLAYYATMTLNRDNNNTAIAYYPEGNYQDAVRSYEEKENEASNSDNVLVSVSNLRKLHEAYPNYFKDITRFAKIINVMLDSGR